MSRTFIAIIAILFGIATWGFARASTNTTVYNCQISNRSAAKATIPKVILWAWTHDDDLRFIDTKSTAIAYYAGTIKLGSETATLLKRTNALKVPNGSCTFPVFRIENAHQKKAATKHAFDAALKLILNYENSHPAQMLQIDYDACTLDRAAYLQFLRDLRKSVGAGKLISVTALASWCLGDRWLDTAPIDESVAMLFSMGKDKAQTLSSLFRRKLDAGGSYDQSVGLSINEAASNEIVKRSVCLSDRSHIYAFSSTGWTKSRYEYLLREIRQ